MDKSSTPTIPTCGSFITMVALSDNTINWCFLLETGMECLHVFPSCLGIEACGNILLFFWRVVAWVVLRYLVVGKYDHWNQHRMIIWADWCHATCSTWHGKYTVVLCLCHTFGSPSRAWHWLKTPARHMSLAMHLSMKHNPLSALMGICHPSWRDVDYPSMAIVYLLNRSLSCSPNWSLFHRLLWHCVNGPIFTADQVVSSSSG